MYNIHLKIITECTLVIKLIFELKIYDNFSFNLKGYLKNGCKGNDKPTLGEKSEIKLGRIISRVHKMMS